MRHNETHRKTLLERKTFLQQNSPKQSPEIQAVLDKHGSKIFSLAARIVELESTPAAASAENLAFLENECVRLQSENATLRARLGEKAPATAVTVSAPQTQPQQSTPQLTARERAAAAVKIA